MERVDVAPSGQPVTYFASALGRGHGQWIGSAPAVDSEYEVEFDIPGRLIWGEQIDLTESRSPVILERDGAMLIFGTLTSFDGKVAELRLGHTVILVEVDRVECSLPGSVAMKIHQLRLFDANV